MAAFNIFDIIFLAVIVLVVVLSAKKGFVASCLDTFSMAISAFVSYILCKPASDYLYDLFIKDLVKTEFKQTLDDMASGLSVRDKVQGMIGALPETAVKLAESMGISINNMSGTLVSSTADEETLIETVASTLAYEVMITLTEVVVFVILFIVVSLLVKFIASFFSKNLEKLPVIGALDTLLGGVFGLVKALVILFAASVLVYIIVQTSDPGSPLEALKASKFYAFMDQYNPIISILKG
jgi:uncharacterized membrane protein required for colicin V production